MLTAQTPLVDWVSDGDLLKALLSAQSREELEVYKSCIREWWGIPRLNAIARRLSPEQKEQLARLPETAEEQPRVTRLLEVPETVVESIEELEVGHRVWIEQPSNLNEILHKQWVEIVSMDAGVIQGQWGNGVRLPLKPGEFHLNSPSARMLSSE